MQLDEFLNGRSIANLQTLQWLWVPASRRSSSKIELLRILRQSMLSPERVRECFLALGEAHQEFLRGLLRLDGYEGDVDFLCRRLAEPLDPPQAGREVVEELSRRGFLAFSAAKTWNQREALRAQVPQELGDVLADVLNLDTREPGVMLSLRRYLDQLSPEERERLGGAGQALGEFVDGLLRPDAIERRVADLPDPAMQRAVRLALDGHAGVLPLERFPSLGLDIEAVDSPAWRSALESRLLGTFGHLCLLEHDLSDDHECLVVYQEIVQAVASSQGNAECPLDHVYACGIDLLADLLAIVDFVRANPSKLTAAGRFFKGARNQLLPQIALRTTFFMDEESLFGFKLAAARELGLVDVREDGRLHATHAAAEWEARPLAAQARSLLDVLLRLSSDASLQLHFARLSQAARQVLLDSPAGVWYPADAFCARVVSRGLAELLDQGARRDHGRAADDMAVWHYARPPRTVAAMVAGARETLLQALNYSGVADIGRRGDRIFVAASPLAARLVGEEPFPDPSQRLLIVNPDFEVILFPDEGHLGLLHRLCAFCDREKTEVTHHLRITQESIQRGILRGLEPEQIIATLADHCRVPLSQNIEYSIRNWASRVHAAEIETLHVLELPSPAVLDAAVQLPEIAPIVVRRISPTAVALSVPQLDPKAEDALKQLGIHLM